MQNLPVKIEKCVSILLIAGLSRDLWSRPPADNLIPGDSVNSQFNEFVLGLGQGGRWAGCASG